MTLSAQRVFVEFKLSDPARLEDKPLRIELRQILHGLLKQSKDSDVSFLHSSAYQAQLELLRTERRTGASAQPAQSDAGSAAIARQKARLAAKRKAQDEAQYIELEDEGSRPGQAASRTKDVGRSTPEVTSSSRNRHRDAALDEYSARTVEILERHNGCSDEEWEIEDDEDKAPPKSRPRAKPSLRAKQERAQQEQELRAAPAREQRSRKSAGGESEPDQSGPTPAQPSAAAKPRKRRINDREASSDDAGIPVVTGSRKPDATASKAPRTSKLGANEADSSDSDLPDAKSAAAAKVVASNPTGRRLRSAGGTRPGGQIHVSDSETEKPASRQEAEKSTWKRWEPESAV